MFVLAVDPHLLMQFMFTPSDFCAMYLHVCHVHTCTGTYVLASSIRLHVHVHAVFMLRVFVHSCPL